MGHAAHAGRVRVFAPGLLFWRASELWILALVNYLVIYSHFQARTCMTVHISNAIRSCVEAAAVSALEAALWLKHWVFGMNSGLGAATSGTRCVEECFRASF